MIKVRVDLADVAPGKRRIISHWRAITHECKCSEKMWAAGCRYDPAAKLRLKEEPLSTKKGRKGDALPDLARMLRLSRFSNTRTSFIDLLVAQYLIIFSDRVHGAAINVGKSRGFTN